MSSRNQKIEHLGDHLPYELLMLRHAYQRTLVGDWYALDWNAFYEAFVVHARNLFEFLMNEGGSNNFKACDFSNFTAKKDPVVQRLINQDLHWQVFHFGKQRKSEDEEKVGKDQRRAIFDWIEANFNAFIAALDRDLRAHWYPERADPEKVRVEFTKGRDKIALGLAPQSASTGKPQSQSFTGPARPPRQTE